MSEVANRWLRRKQDKMQRAGLEPVDDVALAMAGPRAAAAPSAPAAADPIGGSAPMAPPASPAYKPLGLVNDPDNPFRYPVPEGHVDPMGKPVPSTPLNFAPRADGKIGFYDREARARENRTRDLADPSLRVVNPMSGTTKQGGKWAAWGTMAPPAPGLPAPDAVRTAMGGGAPAGAAGRPPPQPAMENPMARDPGAAAAAADPMAKVPMRDRLTMLMWRGSRDTKGLKRYNELARKYDMPLQDVPKTMDERRREAAGIPAWAPDGRGGIFNPSTGEARPAGAAPEPIDWNKRMVQQADGTYIDMETKQVFGKPKEREQNWTAMPNGQRLETKSGKTAGMITPPTGKDQYIGVGDGLYDVVNRKYVFPDGTDDPRRDEDQGEFVRMTTGKDSYYAGIMNKKTGVYEWSKNAVTKAGKVDFGDGRVIEFGGEKGMDLSYLPEYKPRSRRDSGQAPAQADTPAPIGAIVNVNGKRVKKVAEGKWEEI